MKQKATKTIRVPVGYVGTDTKSSERAVDVDRKLGGLAITKDLVLEAWRITHLASGRSVIANPLTLAEARRVLPKLAKLTDWKRPANAIVRNQKKALDLAAAIEALGLEVTRG